MPEYLDQVTEPHVIQHTDRNLSWWSILGIRFTVSGFASMPGTAVGVVRSSTSRSGRGFLESYPLGCRIPRSARRSLWALPNSRSLG